MVFNVIYDDGFESVVCNVLSSDVSDAKEEWSKFLHCEGRIYKMCPYKNPQPEYFLKAFFGRENEDAYEYAKRAEDVFDLPCKFVCDSTDTARTLYDFLRQFEYYDNLNSYARSFELKGNKVVLDEYDW